MTLREQIIHDLRSQGWSWIEAENEADERLMRSAQGIEAQRAETAQTGSVADESPVSERKCAHD